MSAVENPPAFPQRQFDSFGHGEDQAGPEGMTLRDYFAGHMLAGVMVNSTGLGGMSEPERQAMWQQVAALIYEGADAMLAARQEQAA